eukprot:5434524-Alexandrium_andersonii.AAC.1
MLAWDTCRGQGCKLSTSGVGWGNSGRSAVSTRKVEDRWAPRHGRGISRWGSNVLLAASLSASRVSGRAD